MSRGVGVSDCRCNVDFVFIFCTKSNCENGHKNFNDISGEWSKKLRNRNGIDLSETCAHMHAACIQLSVNDKKKPTHTPSKAASIEMRQTKIIPRIFIVCTSRSECSIHLLIKLKFSVSTTISLTRIRNGIYRYSKNNGLNTTTISVLFVYLLY